MLLRKAFDCVAIGASAGGPETLGRLLGGLSADFPCPIVIVQHVYPTHRSQLAGILSRATKLMVKEGEESETILPGHVYTAPPDHHMLVNLAGRLSMNQNEKQHYVRPSADPLFQSVALKFRSRAIALVLTGTGSDGNIGITTIKEMGGTVIVEDPATAAHSGMPRAAVATGCPDYVLPLEQIAPTLDALVRTGACPAGAS